MYTAWRKAIRNLLNIPYQTHCSLLPHICENVHIERQIHSRVFKFLHNILKCSEENECVNIALKLMINGSTSTMSNSITKLCYVYNYTRDSICEESRLLNDKDCECEQQLKCIASSIRDLIQIRDNASICIISREEAQRWLEALCTD